MEVQRTVQAHFSNYYYSNSETVWPALCTLLGALFTKHAATVSGIGVLIKFGEIISRLNYLYNKGYQLLILSSKQNT